MPTGHAVVPFAVGVGDVRLNSQGFFGPKTTNFHPALRREPYIQNYAGRVDTFRRDHDPQVEPWIGTPPSTGTDITRLVTFQDPYGEEHILFVQGAFLCEVRGNGYRELYEFRGAAHEDRYYPWFEVTQGRIYIANEGDEILVYDGVEAVTPLGITEVPLPPDLRTSAAPMTNFDDGQADSPGTWQWVGHWWPGEPPPSGPTENIGADGTSRIHGYYQVVCQFKDRFGNKGRTSPPSLLVGVKPRYALDPADTDPQGRDFLYYDLTPPLHDVHVSGVVVGRTLNQNTDGGVGVAGSYHQEHEFVGTCGLREVCQLRDTELADMPILDTTVMPPPAGTGIAIIGGRAWVWGGADPTLVYYSDLGFHGQFRLSQVYRARTRVSRVIGVGDRTTVGNGDRIVVVGTQSVEVLYESEVGPSLLHQDFDNGSSYGRSFVNMGPLIFGLWTRGYGFFDGQKLEIVPTPFWLEQHYLDPSRIFSSACRWRNWYLVSVREQYTDGATNLVLLMDLETRQWYPLDEAVYDFCVWEDELLGCDDSIYHLFRGPGRAAVMHIPHYVPEGESAVMERSLSGLKFLGEPAGDDDVNVVVSAIPRKNLSISVSGSLQPSLVTLSRTTSPTPVYDQPALAYALSVPWTGDEDVWLTPQLTKPVAGYTHEFEFIFPADHLIRLRALHLRFDPTHETSL